MTGPKTGGRSVIFFCITSGSSANPFQYTGRENDSTGVYFYRARYYSSGLQRFISEDPIRFPPGANSYEYATDSPTEAIES